MRVAVCVALVVALVCQSARCTKDDFVGTWTDSVGSGGYGLTQSFCVTGNNLYGFYSETGIIRARFTNETTAVGTWYEGGEYMVKSKKPTWGNITLHVSEDGKKLTGVWKFSNGDEGSTISDDKVDSGVPSEKDCWLVWPGVARNMSGIWRWNSDITWMCVNDGVRYTTKYTYDDVTGTSAGVCKNEICRGFWREPQAAGIEMLAYMGEEILYETWWDNEADVQYPGIVESVQDPVMHDIETNLRMADTPAGQCVANVVVCPPPTPAPQAECQPVKCVCDCDCNCEECYDSIFIGFDMLVFLVIIGAGLYIFLRYFYCPSRSQPVGVST